MGEKLVIGPFNKGLKTDVTAFNIDNDSFPTLINAYQWRGRVLRKRGTAPLARLSKSISSTNIGAMANVAGQAQFTGNLISIFGLESTSSIVPGSMTITACGFPWTETVPPSGNLLNPDSQAGSTINYANGDILLTENAGFIGCAVVVSFTYYPGLPVMGLEDWVIDSEAYPQNISFDTKYAYTINTIIPYAVTNISFYNNPIANGTSLPAYVPKTTPTAFHWNGRDYQQFWSTNYLGAFWVTNGVTVPFTTTNIGMQFASTTTTPALSAALRIDATTMDFTIAGNPLVVGDFVYANEFTGINTAGLNWQTGYVITAGNTFRVRFPFATIEAAAYTPGIIQYLTNSAFPTKDCLRWYDGNGWVNFCPPLSQNPYVIDDNTASVYYLVGAKMILPFKGRLLALGAVIQTSSGNPIYVKDVVVFNQNGTPYYTSSFTNQPTATTDNPISPLITFNPILVPTNQVASAPAWFEDQNGFGGFQGAGVDQELTTASLNEDALICGFDNNLQTRFIYSGNDLEPFSFFSVNSEYGSGSTFSIVNMDEGVITRGPRGYIITNQTSCQRIDIENPDQVFEVKYSNNGAERFSSQRDYIKEWVYFTYVSSDLNSKTRFPNQTFLYNYRAQSWAIFNESYTTYGIFRPASGYTWATIGTKYATWGVWDTTWGSGSSQVLNPFVIGGNQQGYVVLRDQGTGEAKSLFIQDLVSGLVTSPDHGMNNGDYIVISGALGTISTAVNGKIFSVQNSTENTFTLVPTPGTGTYVGNGEIQRMYIPKIISKQFPISWGMGRKTRLGVQQYLLSKTPLGQVSLLIFLSQDSEMSYNDGPIVPSLNSKNNSLIYSTVLYTCPESTNLGLSPANINTPSKTNLQQINRLDNLGNSSNSQQQIWHRMNTSLVGDTVQFGLTLNDDQMRDTNFASQFEEIEFHGAILDVTSSSLLS